MSGSIRAYYTQKIESLGELRIGTLEMAPFFMGCKMPAFFTKSLLSGAEKHHNFQVISCFQNFSTNIKFDD
jgi:hypothetical protein